MPKHRTNALANSETRRDRNPGAAQQITSRVEAYYSAKLAAHGPTARGVDWNSAESQQLRFRQLLKVCDDTASFTLNDYGCGYGALADYLREGGVSCCYSGFDISPRMIDKAKELHPGTVDTSFVGEEWLLSLADYTIASGPFNVKLETTVADWEKYILEILGAIDKISRRGFAFNMLTKYSDVKLMRPDLYYADPLIFFDHCKTHFSRFVTLLHDYPLYEFTILVKKE